MHDRILFLAPSWLGDAVMALPTLSCLRRLFPAARIAVVSRRGVSELWLASSDASDVLVYERGNGADRFVGYVDLVSRLRAFGPDLAIVLPRSFGSAWTALLSDAPRRIGYRASGRDLLLTDPVARSAALLRTHRVHYYQHLLSALGAEPAPEAPRIAVPDELAPRASALLAPLADGEPSRIIGMIPGAQYGTAKQWPEERYAALGKLLQDRLGARIVLLGGAQDRDVCDRIRHEIDPARVLDLAGRTSVLELAAVLDRCRFAVSNDTGAMHVAAAVGTPVLAIFGSTDPATTTPYGKAHTVLREPVECSPCLLRTCPIDHRCMTRIEVERVLEACERQFAA